MLPDLVDKRQEFSNHRLEIGAVGEKRVLGKDGLPYPWPVRRGCRHPWRSSLGSTSWTSGERTAMFLNWSKVTIRSHGRWVVVAYFDPYLNC